VQRSIAEAMAQRWCSGMEERALRCENFGLRFSFLKHENEVDERLLRCGRAIVL
jgi:hypothetical protein